MPAATGRTVFAALVLHTAAMPAGAIDGTITIGHHIILLPKLALSCSVKISAAVINAPTAASPARLRSKRPVRMSVIARLAVILDPPPGLRRHVAAGLVSNKRGAAISRW